MKPVKFEIHELLKEQDPVTGETYSGDEVYLGKRSTENSAIRYAVRMAPKCHEVQVRAYDQREELTGHWFIKGLPGGMVNIDKIL